MPGARRQDPDRLGPSVRDSPTYEDFADPLEARRQKRKEERERDGNARDSAGGSGSGRGRQYITSFETSDKVSFLLVRGLWESFASSVLDCLASGCGGLETAWFGPVAIASSVDSGSSLGAIRLVQAASVLSRVT